MPNHARFKPSDTAFPELSKVEDPLWGTLRSGLVALADRPRDRNSITFADDVLTPLSSITTFAMRFHMTDRPNAKKAQRSVILLALKWVFEPHSCNVYVDARTNPECSPAVYDLLLPRRMWGAYRHHLDPANKTAADLAITMFRETKRVVEAKETIPFEPRVPNIYLAYPVGREPVVERSAQLIYDLSKESGVPAEALTDEDLDAYFWKYSFVENIREPIDWGRRTKDVPHRFVPQRYLARQDSDYVIHPVDSSPCPKDAGQPDEWRGKWFYNAGEARWIPSGQEPAYVYADMSNVIGRPFRNPAFSVLRAAAFFSEDIYTPEEYPEGFKYGDFMKLPDIDAPEPPERDDGTREPGIGPIYGPGGLHDRLADAIKANPSTKAGLVNLMREMMGKTGTTASDDDIKWALDNPHRDMFLSCATTVRVVRYCAPAGDESMTWRLPGIDRLNLYATKPIWTPRAEPAAERPMGSQKHARASAPAPG